MKLKEERTNAMQEQRKEGKKGGRLTWKEKENEGKWYGKIVCNLSIMFEINTDLLGKKDRRENQMGSRNDKMRTGEF